MDSPKQEQIPEDRFETLGENGTPRSHRLRNPLENTTNKIRDVQQTVHQDPVTPTSNFKLLTSLAASLEYAESPTQKPLNRKLDLSRQNSQILGEENICPSENEKPVSSRKDKSLGLLCQRFLSSYPDYPDPDKKFVIGLDEVAKELGVERRRIYDIVNVLESVDVVSKIAKNTYSWHGKVNLVFSLTKLMAVAEEDNMGERLRALQEQLLHEEARESYPFDEGPSFHEEESQSSVCSSSSQVESRKDKSLAIITQKFLMLFLVSQTKTINLDLAARAINGVYAENGNKKTKTRRLYDIANVLQSFGLIQKVFVNRNRGRKPAFRYTGPDLPVGLLNSNSAILNSEDAIGKKRPLQPEDYLKDISNNLFQRSKLPRTRSENLQDQSSSSVKGKSTSLVRHSSLQEICEIAERERKKLYPEDGGPDSPGNSVQVFQLHASSRMSPQPIILSHGSSSKCHPKVLTQEKKCALLSSNCTDGFPITNWPLTSDIFLNIPTAREEIQNHELVTNGSKDGTNNSVIQNCHKPNIIRLAVMDPSLIVPDSCEDLTPPKKLQSKSGGLTQPSLETLVQPGWTGILESPLVGLNSYSPMFSSSRLFFLPSPPPLQQISPNSIPQSISLVPVHLNSAVQMKKVVVRKLAMNK